MNEEQFAVEMYPRVMRAAKRLAHDFKNRIESEDLAQIGAIAVIGLYRKHGSAPHIALASRAAWCQMLDAIRLEIGRPGASNTRKEFRKPRSLSDIPDDYTDDKFSTLSDRGREADQLEREIDLDRMLATVGDPRERAVIDGVLEGFTFYEIGDRLRVNSSRAAQVKRSILDRLREQFT